MENKRGWIKIVEAFISILIIVGVVLMLLNKGYIGKSDISEKVYDSQIAILREIELNNKMREIILSLDSVPVEWEDFTSLNELDQIKDKINSRIPAYLVCTAKICALDQICSLKSYEEKDVYAQAVAIAANTEIYLPRQLKLFCWRKP